MNSKTGQDLLTYHELHLHYTSSDNYDASLELCSSFVLLNSMSFVRVSTDTFDKLD